MIDIVFSCDHKGCDATRSVHVDADRYFRKPPLAWFVPFGWHIRTPKQGFAVAYCPWHLDGR